MLCRTDSNWMPRTLSWCGIGTRQQLTKLTISQLPLSSATVDLVPTVTNLGVVIDGQLTMATHTASVCRSGFFQLRQLKSIRRSLTTEATRALLQAFIVCRLEYCNSLLARVAEVYLQRLQSVQNAAARLLSGARRHDRITRVLETLHWLPVRKRIIFKTAVLVWKCLHSIAVPYLVDLRVPVASAQCRQHLRSASSGMLLVPRTRTTIGQRSFAVNGPTTWNWLPASLRSSDMTLRTFRRQLKTFLFQHWHCWNNWFLQHSPAPLWLLFQWFDARYKCSNSTLFTHPYTICVLPLLHNTYPSNIFNYQKFDIR